MTNTARKLTFEGPFTLVKDKLDVAFVSPAVMMEVSVKANLLIAEIERRKLKLNLTKEQIQVYDIDIRKLEALQQRMIDMTLDAYSVDAEAYVDSVGMPKDDSIKDVLIDIAAKADNKDETSIATIEVDGKEVETPKLSDIGAACKVLIKKGNFDSAHLMASKYLTVANYIPKKEKQTPKKWNSTEIDSWLKDINAALMEEKRNTGKKSEIVVKESKSENLETNKDAAAKGLTAGEVEELKLLNYILISSIAGQQDYESRREVLKKYLNTGKDLDTETKMLEEFSKRIYASTHGEKLPETELAKLYADIDKFEKLFFAKRGYTEESVKAWHEAARTELKVEHFKILKTKPGFILFPIKEKSATENKVDPSIEKSKKIKSKDIIPISEIKLLLSTMIENGGEMTDVKLHPEIIGLVGKEIKMSEKSQSLKFNEEKTLFAWIETIFNGVKKELGTIKKATDEEVANASAAVKEKITESKEDKKSKPEHKLNDKVYTGEITASLDDILLLIETAVKSEVSKEDFFNSNKDLMVDKDGKIFKLKSKGKDGKSASTIVLADEKDLKEWIATQYKNFANFAQQGPKEKTTENSEKENKDNNLVNTFKELIANGKALLEKGTPYEQFMEWLNKNVLNRRLKEQKEGNEFKTPEKVKEFAKATFNLKIEETSKPEEKEKIGESSQKYSVEDIAEIMRTDCVAENATFANLARSMRDLYISNEIKINDADITAIQAFEILEEIIKDVNPTMYKERMERKEKHAKKNKDQGTLSLENKETKVNTDNVNEETKDVEKQIFEPVDLQKLDSNLYETIKKINTMDGIYNMAKEFNEAGKFNEALSVCLEVMPRIPESKDWTSEQITDWFNKNILVESPISGASETAEAAPIIKEGGENVSQESISDNADIQDSLKIIQEANSNKHFKRAIAAILKKREDSTAVRDIIVNAIRTGNGKYTRNMAKGPVNEIHSMITNIKRKVDNADKSSDNEE